MAEYKEREHYIPLRQTDLVELLCRDRGMNDEMADRFRRAAHLIAAMFHFEFHERLVQLKDTYAPFDPDGTTHCLKELSAEERAGKLDVLFDKFVGLLERANFRRLDKADLEEAAKQASAFGIDMNVDYTLFDRLAGFSRGDSTCVRHRRRWWPPFKKEAVELPTFRRFVLFVKLKPSSRLPADVSSDVVFLKIFKDIPRIDLDMLLPAARIRMPGLARMKLGGSVLSGLGMIVYNIIQTGIALGTQLFTGPILALLGYGYKQYYGYQTTKNSFNLQLTQSLYYQNLDNNAGVLTHLLDEAEEQECREALLGYYCLWLFAGEAGWTISELDDYVEMDLERLAGIKVDFEIHDALAKLERLNLVTRNGERYLAVPIERALENLDYAWDNYFAYNNEARERRGVGEKIRDSA